MASINRYCEERISGYWIQKTIKLGQVNSTISNLISSAVISVLSVVVGLTLFAGFIITRLPYQEIDLSIFLLQTFFICCLTVLGSGLSILIAAITKNKFYAFIIPLLLFYSENEFLSGGIYFNFAIKTLMNPENKIISLGFIVIITFLCYLAVDRVEKGRCGFGA